MERIKGHDTVDIGGGKRGFRSQNALAGVNGTEVTDAFLNSVQEEICTVIEKAGIVLDTQKNDQLHEALMRIVAPGFANRIAWMPVLSVTITAPPTNAALGDAYIIPTGATGAWTGQAQKLAEWNGIGWNIITTKDGHGVGLPDGRVFERVSGIYVELFASREWVNSRQTPVTQLNALPWLPVKSMTVTAPPAATEGDLYLIPASATGAWAGKAGQIAEWSGGAWMFRVPADGHGISLSDGRVFERISGSYVEKLALDTQSGKWTYAQAGGSADALAVTLNPVPSSLSAGLSIRVKASADNTGPATLNVNGLGAKAITRAGGDILQPNDIVSGQVIDLTYDGIQFQISNLNPALVPSNSSIIFATAGSTTWQVPDGVYLIHVRLWGGGGGGGGAVTTSAGVGGHGSGYADGAYRVVPGTVLPIIVGLGGASGTASGINGGNGGTSSVGSFISATGGGGGAGASTANTVAVASGGAGIGTGGILNVKGQGAANAYNLNSRHASGGAGTYSTSGTSMTVGGGVGSGYPGGGGSGGANGYGGSKGADGLIVIEF